MKEVYVEEVIISTMRRRGNGIKHSPIRCITEVYSKDGEKIAEHDPMPELFTVTDMVHFAKWASEKKRPIIPATVHEWLESIENKS